MAYHEEDRIARLIRNWDRWHGDKPIQGTSRLWIEGKIAIRDMRRDFQSNFGNFEALGQEALITKETLSAMVGGIRHALLTFHLSSLTFEMQARSIVGVSKSTYHARLVRGHFEFMEEYARQQQIGRDRVDTYLRLLKVG
jgi:hypothetical protein